MQVSIMAGKARIAAKILFLDLNILERINIVIRSRIRDLVNNLLNSSIMYIYSE